MEPTLENMQKALDEVYKHLAFINKGLQLLSHESPDGNLKKIQDTLSKDSSKFKDLELVHRQNDLVATWAIEGDIANYQYFDKNQQFRLYKKALSMDVEVIKYMPVELKGTRLNVEDITRILEVNPLLLKYLPEDYKIQKRFCFMALEKNISALAYVENLEILDNKEIICKAVEKDGLLLEYASRRLKNDFEIIITAVVQNKEASKFVSKKIREKILMLFT